MTPDIVVRGGKVFDGLGATPQTVDILVQDGVIAEIGKVSANGTCEIDATGLYVAPGFIDIHSHSDFTLLVDPRAISSITQGVTLEVIGNCGHGCFPLDHANGELRPFLWCCRLYGIGPPTVVGCPS